MTGIVGDLFPDGVLDSLSCFRYRTAVPRISYVSALFASLKFRLLDAQEPSVRWKDHALNGIVDGHEDNLHLPGPSGCPRIPVIAKPDSIIVLSPRRGETASWLPRPSEGLMPALFETPPVQVCRWTWGKSPSSVQRVGAAE
eukprot:4520726-Amphidinium_carterae.1